MDFKRSFAAAGLATSVVLGARDEGISPSVGSCW